MSNNYAEETKPLFKLLSNPAFRFIIVRYNHYNLIRQLMDDLRKRFSDRKIITLDTQRTDYQQITQQYFDLGSGFFILEHFEDVLKEERDSRGRETPQMSQNNERRRDITAGLNLRRDKLAQYPVVLMVLIPASAGELYARMIMEKMPDLWSFRSLMVDLEAEKERQNRSFQLSGFTLTDESPFLADAQKTSRQTELVHLLEQLEHTPKEEITYRSSLYPQIVKLQKELGQYESALHTLDAWEKIDAEPDIADIRYARGEIYELLGQLENARVNFTQALAEYEQKENEYGIIQSSLSLANVFGWMGEANKSFEYYELSHERAEKLYEKFPQQADNKWWLAIVKEKAGDRSLETGQPERALVFFEDSLKLFEELSKMYPENPEFAFGLAVSNSKVGQVIGILEGAPASIPFFERFNHLMEELHKIESSLRSKYNLAVSNQYLGAAYTDIGEWDSALKFFTEYNRHAQEIYKISPNNIFYKNLLAISYQWLGWFYEKKLQNKEKAKECYYNSQALSRELVESFPTYQEFRKNFEWVENALAEFS
ncbi:MAG: tetratricopeptide repeat protein [Bacteroidia bacterium]|nr:tetratricopeptide repeat protein [Bacteroidia bacterium]